MSETARPTQPNSSGDTMAVVIQRPRSAAAAWYRTEYEGDILRLIVGGSWIISEARQLDPMLRALDPRGHARIMIDCGALERLDTVGAWLLLRTKRVLEHEGLEVQAINVREEYRALVHTIDHECRAPPVQLPRPHTFTDRLERIGRGLFHALHQAYSIGRLLRPRRISHGYHYFATKPVARCGPPSPD